MFGTPEILKTDNGPPWNSEQMRNFTHHLGFKHRKIIPYWPQANGEAERFMRTLAIEGKAWKQELHAMLRNYRATPHTSTGKPPASLLFGREMKIKLPNTKPFTVNKEAIRKDNATKTKMKEYTDQKRKARPNNLLVGDTVLVRQPRQNTLTAAYDHAPTIPHHPQERNTDHRKQRWKRDNTTLNNVQEDNSIHPGRQQNGRSRETTSRTTPDN
ncbi:Hypp668 [Branchiostoma lanceolatum]|uniref:Hypp668 protein n=1 Tax=Branchiostoma lanceolatum TaxID=7740 RepID=A0A8J9W520_BRALA|nr:Hypp668 [Branchiostoma lanceolatum]